MSTESVAGFAIAFYVENVIESNSEERFEDMTPKEKRDVVSSGFVNKHGHILSEGWDQLNKDMIRAERNSLAWMRQKFATVRDDGHDGYSDLVGNFWFDPTNPDQAYLVELAADTGRSERIDMVDTSFGDLGRTAFNGISDFGASVLGGQITFFDVQPEDMEIIEGTLRHHRAKRSAAGRKRTNVRSSRPTTVRDPGAARGARRTWLRQRRPLPAALHAAYDWTDAASELEELRAAEGEELLRYCIASESNAIEHDVAIRAVDLLALHDWLVAS